MAAPISSVILYVRNLPAVAAFYQKHFGLVPDAGGTDKWLVLANPAGGCGISLHRAAKSQKSGAAMKIVFAVRDVADFRTRAAREGLEFGAVHQAPGYEFANAKDPAGNSISISSRTFARAK